MKSATPAESDFSKPLLKTLAISGVGLLGGSVALAAKSYGVAEKVIGIGRNTERLQQAVLAGVLDDFVTDFADLPQTTELFVVAAPVSSIAGIVRKALPFLPHDCIITDVGSTKLELEHQLKDLTGDQGTHAFVGAHPIAGGDKSGFEYSTSNLFAGKTCVICPGAAIATATRRVEEFWQALGMITVEMTALAHDEALAKTSHLPHVSASALAGVLTPELFPLTGTGFRETSRVAMGSSELWVTILETNRKPVIQSLRALRDQLQYYVDALESGNSQQLFELLHQAELTRKAIEPPEVS